MKHRGPLPAQLIYSRSSIGLFFGQPLSIVGDEVAEVAAGLRDQRGIGVLFLLAQLLVACESTRNLSADETSTLLRGPIRVGMSREEVISLLGAPHRQEQYGVTEFVFYATRYQVADKAATRTPIALIEGKVVGWASRAIQRIRPVMA